MEGAEQKLWSFADSTAAWPMVWAYRQERDGVFSAAKARDAADRAGKPHADETASIHARKGPGADAPGAPRAAQGSGGTH